MCTYSAIPTKLSGSWSPSHSLQRHILLHHQGKCLHTKFDCTYRRFTIAYWISGQLPSQIHQLVSPLLLIKHLFNHCSNIWPSLLANNKYGQALVCLWTLCKFTWRRACVCMSSFLTPMGIWKWRTQKPFRRLGHPIPMRTWMPRYLGHLWKTLS